MSSPSLPPELALPELERARRDSADVVSHTPVLSAGSLSSRFGGRLALKAENLQRTGSFKIRGALNKLRQLGSERGAVAGSAGNHAQSLAYAARTFGVGCEVFMPADAAVGKLAAVRAFGATVHQEADSVDECVEQARVRAAESGAVFVHPFDDLDVVAGQAGVGLEILADCPDVATVVVPIGGGGLVAGVAAALKQERPEVRVVGVQAERCAPFLEPERRLAAAARVATIADGIAVKRPGEITSPLVEQLVDGVVAVSETAIAEAMALLLERAKMVVEGAGAAALASVIGGAVELDPAAPTVVILSGGNADTGLLARVAAHQETMQGRRMRILTKIPDRPGGLARLLATVAAANANLLAVEHVRESPQLDFGETGVALTLETRGHDHAEAVREALRQAGYQADGG